MTVCRKEFVKFSFKYCFVQATNIESFFIFKMTYMLLHSHHSVCLTLHSMRHEPSRYHILLINHLLIELILLPLLIVSHLSSPHIHSLELIMHLGKSLLTVMLLLLRSHSAHHHLLRIGHHLWIWLSMALHWERCVLSWLILLHCVFIECVYFYSIIILK